MDKNIYAGEIGYCYMCNTNQVEICNDGVCKNCHVSVSWEDCMDQTYNAQVMSRSGRSKESLKKMFPRARI
jgi:hypothetical protein